jgi:hypothetical protein
MVDVVEWPGVSGMITTFPPRGPHLVGTDDGVRRIIAALDDDVGLKDPHELARRVLLEHGDRVHALECRQHVDTLAFRPHRAIGALEPLDGRVVIHSDDEDITARPSPYQHVNVSRVKQIEHAICEHDAACLTRPPFCERPPRHDLSTRVDAGQYVHSACGENRMSRTINGISTRS